MNKINCILLASQSTSSNFIVYKTLKKLNLSNKIQVEETECSFTNFLFVFARENNNDCPELIFLDRSIAENKNILHHLNEKKYSNLNKVMVVLLNEKNKYFNITNKNNLRTIYLNEPLTPTNINSFINNNGIGLQN